MRLPLPALAAALVLAGTAAAAAQSGGSGFSGTTTGSGTSASTGSSGTGTRGGTVSTLRNSGTAGNSARLVTGNGTRTQPAMDNGSSGASYGGGSGSIRAGTLSEAEARRLYPDTAASGVLTGRPTPPER